MGDRRSGGVYRCLLVLVLFALILSGPIRYRRPRHVKQGLMTEFFFNSSFIGTRIVYALHIMIRTVLEHLECPEHAMYHVLYAPSEQRRERCGRVSRYGAEIHMVRSPGLVMMRSEWNM